MSEDEDILTTQTKLAAEVTPQVGGTFEITAITTGEGNGWKFSEACLQGSLPLWEGAEVFIDHGSLFEYGRSVRDLAGICTNARFDRGGVVLDLKTSGPSKDLLEAIGKDWLSSTLPRPRIGFSADVVFTAKQKEVIQILRVNSLDLVFNPARGGAFVRALYSERNNHMPQEEDQVYQLQADEKIVKSLNSATEEPLPVKKETQPEVDPLRVALCDTLLKAKLNGVQLPPTLKAKLQKDYGGRIFDPADLDHAIDEGRQLMADLQGSTNIRGPYISDMVSCEERLQAAVDDLFGAPREKHMEGRKVERLTGIKELYLGMTGDLNFQGGFHPEEAKFATTSTMTGLVKNALNKMLVQDWDTVGNAGYNWWQPIATVEHFDTLNQPTSILMSEFGLIPSVSEGAAYTELQAKDSPEVGTFTKYGGYLPLTLELIDRDDLSKLKVFPRKLANAAMRRISSTIGLYFTTGSGTAMADGYGVFSTEHGNIWAVPAATGTILSNGSSIVESSGSTVFNQSMLAGTSGSPIMAVDPKYLIVPRASRIYGYRIRYPNFEYATNIHSENMMRGEYGDVITCPEISGSSVGVVMCDPRIAPAIYVGERYGLKPEIFIAGDERAGAMFTNDEVRIKVRHFLAIWVADYRPMFRFVCAGG